MNAHPGMKIAFLEPLSIVPFVRLFNNCLNPDSTPAALLLVRRTNGTVESGSKGAIFIPGCAFIEGFLFADDRYLPGLQLCHIHQG